jgi:hypothetical protein
MCAGLLKYLHEVSDGAFSIIALLMTGTELERNCK